MQMRLPSRAIAVAAMMAAAILPCLASEVAVLKNGFSIRHERHKIIGDVTRLYVNADGSSFVDVPTSQVDHFEAAPDLPKAVAPQPASTYPNSPGHPVVAARGFPARSQADLSQVVNEASDRYRLDPDLVTSVIKAESAFNAHAVSPKGAQGLMQLMPGTASQLGVPNAFDPQANVEGGTKYLRELLERYNFDVVKALAAYNAGPQRVEQFGGVPPYYETRAYVARVVRDFNKKKVAQKKATAASTHSLTAKATTTKAHTSTSKSTASGTLTQAKASSAGLSN